MDRVLEVGMKVEVRDPGLAQLRMVMRQAGAEPEPNHHGIVQDIWEDTNPVTVIVLFDDGVAAPYPLSMVWERKDG